MNKQRLQAYLQLIESLLSCPNGEENQILAANQELLDTEFVQVVTEIAERYEQEGKKNIAGWLRNLTAYLTPENTPITEADIQTYLQFLQEVLRTTVDSNGNVEVIYPLLAANTDKLNRNFVKILQLWANHTLAEAIDIAYWMVILGNRIQPFPLGNKADNMEIAIAGYEIALTVYTRTAFPEQWATTQNSLGNAYRERILGQRADNLEQAIAAHNAALEFYTRIAFPEQWAMVQNNLGNAYREKILGEKAENIEKAIAAYNAALEVYTRTAFPEQWATLQNNLGNAYGQRILEQRAHNIEKALAAYNAALEVRTRNVFPVDWAMTQNNLGAAYSDRILGQRADNLELTIAAYNAALEVRTHAAFPVDWAATQNNLGNAYGERILGQRSQNLESAIAAFKAALEVCTPTAFPEQWAMVQNNLGNAYKDRILGQRADNLKLAIAAYNAALEVRTRAAFPVDWAMTQNNLGNAYSDRILEGRAENLESAIAAYNAALEVYTRSAYPEKWAMTQNHLGNAYSERILGQRAQNIESAIAAYNAALEVFTPTAFSQQWAMTQNNLGLVYRQRILGERADNLKLAIVAYNAALEVFTPTAFPKTNAEVLSNLGVLYQYETRQFDLAYDTFAQAIEILESLRGEINSGEEAKHKQAEESNGLYRSMVEACLALNKHSEAIEYTERSKTRNLVELILDRDLKTIFPPEIVTQLEKLNNKIASGQYELQNSKADNPQALAQNIQQWRQQRQSLQDSYLPVGSGFKFDQFQQNLDNNTAIIEWYIVSNTIITFIIKPNGKKLTYWQSQPEDLDVLLDWVNVYIEDYYNPKDHYKIQWQNQLEARIQKLAQILHIEEIIAQLPKECERLILIPYNFLHLFPLHTLPIQESYLMDLFPQGVGYAPSLQILQQVQLRQRPNFQSLFAVKNPTADLYQGYDKDFGAVSAIKKQFTQAHILQRDKAKKSTILDINQNAATLNPELLKVNCAFFFCHGFFDRNSPLDSGLQLADESLILADIITHFTLENCRLVTLSACETGFTQYTNTSDEYIGLPSGFLLAGSTNVVSSLWTVDAKATAFLMIKFYEELQQQDNITLALNTAQHWLRNTSVKDFRTWLRASNLDDDWQDELDEQFAQIQRKQGESAKIFASPFYWSAFCAIGKGY